MVLNEIKINFYKIWHNRYQNRFAVKLNFSNAASAFTDKNDLYLYMNHYFHHFCPQIIKDHRKYFRMNRRGFGEDAFHAMWGLLFQEYKPQNCLEIGVYRGQVISLWSLIAKILDYPCDIQGISPLASAGDSVSNYLNNIDYEKDIAENFNYFDFAPPKLIRAYSTDEKAIEFIYSKKWDLIYIDGSHDFDIAIKDYMNCKNNLSKNGFLILDDSSLGTDYKPLPFAFGGHPGPSQVCRDFAMHELKYIATVGHNNIFRLK